MLSTSQTHPNISVARCWRRLTKSIRRHPSSFSPASSLSNSSSSSRSSSRSSTSSCTSSTSSKSVRFENIDTVWYTHSSEEYDRAGPQDSIDLPAALGSIFLSEPERAIIENPKQDKIVAKNTANNAKIKRRNEHASIMMRMRHRS